MGVGKRLARLTSKSISTGNKQLNQIYPDHASVLEKEILIAKTLNNLHKHYKLRWIWVSMAYRHCKNLLEWFNGDLTTELSEGLISQDFCSRPCNCSTHTKVNVECIFGRHCRAKYIVCKLTCKFCRWVYIGMSQQFLKRT
jgi:hypothetical protein